MQLEVKNFKKVMSKFVTGITVVTIQDSNQNSFGITVNSFNSVSINPLLVLFSINVESFLHNVILETGRFAINILANDQQNLSTKFTKPSSIDWNKIDHTYSKISNSPILSNAIAYLDCSIFDTLKAGDHTIIVSNVHDFQYYDNHSPLIYYDGNYHNLEKK